MAIIRALLAGLLLAACNPRKQPQALPATSRDSAHPSQAVGSHESQPSGTLLSILRSFESLPITGFDTLIRVAHRVPIYGNGKDFALSDAPEYVRLYRQLVGAPQYHRFVQSIRHDSTEISQGYRSAFLLLALGTVVPADPAYACAGFLNRDTGVLYVTRLNETSNVEKTSIGKSFISVLDSIARLHPRSVDEAPSDGDHIRFLAVVTPETALNVVAGQDIGYLMGMEYEEWPFKDLVSYERFRERQFMDSLIYLVSDAGGLRLNR